ncbi:hypothetical protein ACFQ7F_00560 [Streptomyces sp. NPDC056486]|uniref:hypothetical protein n=1 Tax=Streptomyces sp. NPDC056486 TaxID=3345835 RepID=UPI00369EF9F6
MANASDGAPQGQRGAFSRAWSEHPATMLAAVIGALAVLVAALFPLLTKEESDVNNATAGSGDTIPASPPDSSSDPQTEPTADRTNSTAAESPAKSPPPSAAKPRWKGPIKIPVNLNSVSGTGAELDDDEPGNLVGIDDDLRGDYSTTPAVLVMTGRAAEVGKPLEKITKEICEQRIPVKPSDPKGITAYRTGTYCFATSEGDVAAFAVTSTPSIQDIPSELTIQVVLWE